jgi:hypothetical protein
MFHGTWAMFQWEFSWNHGTAKRLRIGRRRMRSKADVRR